MSVSGATKNSSRKVIWNVKNTSREVVAYCPRCKAIETLTCTDEGIVPTSRFTVKAGTVYHACGSDIPCRLYSLS